jgi:hypothetical protein
MSAIKNSYIVLSNGYIVGYHKTEDEAHSQSLQLAEEWREQSDLGAEVPAPRLAVLDFNSYWQLKQISQGLEELPF